MLIIYDMTKPGMGSDFENKGRKNEKTFLHPDRASRGDY